MSTLSLRLSEPAPLAGDVVEAAASWWVRAIRWIHSTWCVLNGGHYKVLHAAPTRLALRCVACGYTTPGWAVGSPRLRRTLPGHPDRLRMPRAA
jgi:hypothetical protein